MISDPFPVTATVYHRFPTGALCIKGGNLAETHRRDDVRMTLRTRIIVAALATAVFSNPAYASGGAKEEKVGDKAAAGSVGQYVDVQPVGLPIVVEGGVVNYVFVYTRVNLTTSANVAKLREQEPFFREALVRAAHRAPFTAKGDYNTVDAARLIATLTREANTIAGPGQIKGVVITSQVPRRRIVLPRTASKPAPKAAS